MSCLPPHVAQFLIPGAGPAAPVTPAPAAPQHAAQPAPDPAAPAAAAAPAATVEALALLPAVLELAKQALPDDATRAAQTEFVRARQVLFLENLSVTGSARSAAAAAGVSHQTAYRARRSCAAFRMGRDAALLHARAHAADTLACRAIEGVEEQVFYHGEVIATRRRYSDRLLLAHLARLDRAAEADPRANGFAEDWDAAIARFAAGEEPLPEPAPAAPEDSFPEPCNTRSMSPDRDPDSGGESDDGEEPEDELLAMMRAARPPEAKPPHMLGDAREVEAFQLEAFSADCDRWWTIANEADLDAALDRMLG